MDQHQFLIDCGEGTQMQLSRYKIKRSRINHIFISHLHGDHYFGLAGLITSMGLLGRETELHLFAPPPLKAIIDLQLQAADTKLPYQLHFHPLGAEGLLVDDSKFQVETFKVFHRIECWGFIIREKRKPRKINKEKIGGYKLSAESFEKLKVGENVTTENGELIEYETVTLANPPNRSYAFCADTMYAPSLAEKVKDVSMLYHETTYLQVLEERATARFHSTTAQAADIAVKANAKKLLIGHFSSKYEALDEFLTEAQAIFPNTDLALEGVSYRIT
ncbi:MAG: ribonuclease [Segetibacter sp.]|nr:ribonuclease [Segetibacter sp.]